MNNDTTTTSSSTTTANNNENNKNINLEYKEIANQNGNITLSSKLDDLLADMNNENEDNDQLLGKKRITPDSSQEENSGSSQSSSQSKKPMSFLSRKKAKAAPTIPTKAPAKKKGAMSLDQLLREKKQKNDEKIVTYDELISTQNEKKKMIEEDEDISNLEIEKLKELVKPKTDLMMSYNPHQICLKEMFALQLPKPSEISLVIAKNESVSLTQFNDPCSQLLKKETYNTFKLFIQNGLDSIVENIDISLIPRYLIDVLFSYVCFEKDELTVYQSYKILVNLESRFKDKNNNNNTDKYSHSLTFKDFINVFDLYKIQTDQTFKSPNSTITQDRSTLTLQPASTFPFLNFYYLLSLLKEVTNENIFNFDETKHLILFITLLMLDPNYIRTNKDIDIDSTKAGNNSMNRLKSTIFKTVLLLGPLLKNLVDSFFSHLANESQEKVNKEVQTLFEEIWSSIEESVRLTLCTKVAYFLPAIPIRGIDLQRRFALFSISRILKLDNVENILFQPSIVDEVVKILKPFIVQIKDETLDILLMLNMVTLTDICSNDRNELNQQKRLDKKYPFEKLIRSWSSKIKEPKDFDFNKTRIKEGLILIQSKLASLILDQSSSSIMDFFRPANEAEVQPTE